MEEFSSNMSHLLSNPKSKYALTRTIQNNNLKLGQKSGKQFEGNKKLPETYQGLRKINYIQRALDSKVNASKKINSDLNNV